MTEIICVAHSIDLAPFLCRITLHKPDLRYYKMAHNINSVLLLLKGSVQLRARVQQSGLL